MKNKSFFLVAGMAAGIMLVNSCSDDDDENQLPSISDSELFAKANTTTGFKYYKNVPDTLPSNNDNAHNLFIRTRFNDIALTAMPADVSTLNGSAFPENSVVVKEVYNSKGGPLVLYAVMLKSSAYSNSASGWVWAELSPNGSAVYSASNKGAACISCHSQAGNKDLVRTFAEQ